MQIKTLLKAPSESMGFLLFIFRFAHQDAGNKTQKITFDPLCSLSAGSSASLRINSTNDFVSKSKSN